MEARMDIQFENGQSMTQIATLCFVVHQGNVLLMRKKRGFGQGKIIAPGGRIEAGEHIHDTAVREVLEETGIRPIEPEKRGEIRFYFGQEEEPDWIVHVFLAERHQGAAKETEEGTPYWHNINNLPYDEMWIDDIYWVPLLLDGKKFSATFFFDKDVKNILNYKIVEDGSI